MRTRFCVSRADMIELQLNALAQTQHVVYVRKHLKRLRRAISLRASKHAQ